MAELTKRTTNRVELAMVMEDHSWNQLNDVRSGLLSLE